MKIIDCHVHPRPVKYYREDAAKLLQRMLMHSIEQMILSDLGDQWPAFPDSITVQNANARLQDICLKSSGRMHYLIYLNPLLEDWRDEFYKHCKSAVGVKLWISLHRAGEKDLSSSIEVLQTAAGHGLPVLIHTFEKTDGITGGSVGIDGIIELAQAVPACRIIAAHACGNWRKAVKRADEFPENIVFDVSGGYPERTMVQRLTAAFGSKRLLYGSDAPGRSFGSQLHKVLEANISEAEKCDILYNNSQHIFKLSAPVDVAVTKALPHYDLADQASDHFCFCGNAPWFDHAATVDELAELLQSYNIKHAYTASLTAASAVDKIAENKCFLNECSKYDFIHPLAAVDLENLPQALAQLESMQGFAGVWISPYLHGYKLDDKKFRCFFERCAELEIALWINLGLSDDRFRSSKLPSRNVLNEEIAAFAQYAPVNNYFLQGAVQHDHWSKILPEYFFLEYSRLSDGEYLAGDYSGKSERLVRGSEYPFRNYDEVDNVLQGKV